jgi:hypothetical protein
VVKWLKAFLLFCSKNILFFPLIPKGEWLTHINNFKILRKQEKTRDIPYFIEGV